jgi:hypothetical protein
VKFDRLKNRASIIGHKAVKPKKARRPRVDNGRYGIEREEKDTLRQWDPNKYTNDKMMEFVLDLLIEHTSIRQSQVVLALRAEFGISETNAQSKATSILLIFRQEGWVEYSGKERRSKVWRLVS